MSEPAVPNEEAKTSQQKRRSERQRKRRARRREKKALRKTEAAKEETPSPDHGLHPPTTPSGSEQPFTPVMSKRKQRKANQALRKEEALKKIQDAAVKKAAEISEKAQDSGEQESKLQPLKKSSVQASANTGMGFNKVNPAVNVGCVAALLESLAAVISSGHTGAWTNGPPGQGNGAGHWKPWTKRAKKA